MTEKETTTPQPLVVGLGGTLRTSSSSELALRFTLDHAEAAGVRTLMFNASDLSLPMYEEQALNSAQSLAAQRLIEGVERADALIVASPAYHGGISGLLKNALDYLEELRNCSPPYLDGRVIGCIVTTLGWQAGVTTLSSMRATIHALRAWPTPLGVVLNSSVPLFDELGAPIVPEDREKLTILADQVIGSARSHAERRGRPLHRSID